MLRRFGTVTATERDPGVRAWIAEKTGTTVVDCTLPDTTPLQRTLFDLIVMLDVLDHIEDASSALGNLRPGGRFLVTVPAYPFLWSPHDESLMHFRRYTQWSLTETATGAGMKISRMSYFKYPSYSTTIFQRRTQISNLSKRRSSL